MVNMVNRFSHCRGRGATLACSHCNKQGHTKDVYYKKHGYSSNFYQRQQHNTTINHVITEGHDDILSDKQSLLNYLQENTGISRSGFTPKQRFALLELIKEKSVQ
ncbi:Retrovirus-related Pol polyprotein [Arachis hypogaea]|nr:Retrovirus-related Pol polyprotein [Arachis hypogaea]